MGIGIDALIVVRDIIGGIPVNGHGKSEVMTGMANVMQPHISKSGRVLTSLQTRRSFYLGRHGVGEGTTQKARRIRVVMNTEPRVLGKQKDMAVSSEAC